MYTLSVSAGEITPATDRWDMEPFVVEVTVFFQTKAVDTKQVEEIKTKNGRPMVDGSVSTWYIYFSLINNIT